MNLTKYCLPLLILFSILLINEYISSKEGFTLKDVPGSPKWPIILPSFGSAKFTGYWMKFKGFMSSASATKST
jgi:hypothetical protein